MEFCRSVIRFFISLFGAKDKPPDKKPAPKPIAIKPVAQLPHKAHTANYISKQVDDLLDEDKIKGNTIYIVGENGYYWLAAFKCPCGCNQVIHLNLLEEASPCWKIDIHRDKTVSIIPSIDREIGCRSHFIVKRGVVNWWISNWRLY